MLLYPYNCTCISYHEADCGSELIHENIKRERQNNSIYSIIIQFQLTTQRHRQNDKKKKIYMKPSCPLAICPGCCFGIGTYNHSLMEI